MQYIFFTHNIRLSILWIVMLAAADVGFYTVGDDDSRWGKTHTQL